MIYLNEVAERLGRILEGDENPADFIYDVQTVGFHLDKIYSKGDGRDSIMVFVSQMGGSFNPVPGLNECTASIPITFYFPVRFKDAIFALDAYLHERFVGVFQNYGANTGDCVSNLSISQYGEIQDLDLKEFREWAESVYRKPIEVKEPYMSMTTTLYLSSMNSDFLYGNAFKAFLGYRANRQDFIDANGNTVYGYELVGRRYGVWKSYVCEDGKIRCTIEGQNYVYSEYDTEMIIEGETVSGSPRVVYPSMGLVFASASMQSNSQSSDQQVIGTRESSGLPYGSTTGKSITCYVQKDIHWGFIVNEWLASSLNEANLRLEIQIDGIPLESGNSRYDCYVQSVNMPITKGEPMTATLAFGRRMD